MKEIRFVFFGSSNFSIEVLDTLETLGLSPVAVVTMPDRPKGRKLILTENPVKTWAKERNIKVVEEVDGIKADVFIVASYGKILPEKLINTPKFKTLNVHPSLLPKLRGPAPIQGAILGENETGVSIMRLDSKMDHGPILVQRKVEFNKWPEKYSVVEKTLAEAGAKLLAETLPKWLKNPPSELAGRQNPLEIPQDESLATFTHMIKKEDADISNDSPEIALRKVYAYEIWPRARKSELVITKAHIEDGKFVPDRVIPPGKEEMDYKDYLNGNPKVTF